MGVYVEKLRAGKAEREWFQSLLNVIIECFPKAASVPWVVNPRLSRSLGHCKAVARRVPGDPSSPDKGSWTCTEISINEDFLCRCYRKEVLGQVAFTPSFREGRLIDTMVHEAAHLSHFNHGAFFQMANEDIGRRVKAKLAGGGPVARTAALVAGSKKPASPRQAEFDFG